MNRSHHLYATILLSILLLLAIAATHHYRARSTALEQQLARLDTRGTDTEIPIARKADIITDETNNKTLIITPEDITEFTEGISALETAIAERDAEIGQLQRTSHATPAATAPEPARAQSNWLDNLREEDPERYAEIQARRTEAQQRVRDSFARKAAHFLYRDTATMDDVERAEYEHMLGLLGETWQMAEQLQSPDLNREERWEIRRDVMNNVRTLTPMLEAERDREFYQLAQQLGYDDQRAGEFVDYINDMIEVSTFGSIMRGPRGGGGGRN